MTIDSIFSRKLYADRALTGAYATMRSCLTLGSNENFPNESDNEYGYKPAADKLGWDNLDALTDIINSHMSYGGAASVYYSGTYSAETENTSTSTKMGFNPWQDATWWGIRRALLYIENVDRVPDMTPEEKERGKGEAYMIMGLPLPSICSGFRRNTAAQELGQRQQPRRGGLQAAKRRRDPEVYRQPL